MKVNFTDFTNLTDLLSRVEIMIQKGDYPFSSCVFNHSELKDLVTDADCDEVIFFPVYDLNSSTSSKEVTLLAVGVDKSLATLKAISPAILGDCPPRCKEDTDELNFKNKFTPKITVETKTTGS